jgi:hypothetical protein
MNCKDFESMIHEIASRRKADKTEQLEALEHAGHCLWCALRLDEETRLTESLQAFATTLDVQRAPARVEEALVQAFRERTWRAAAPPFGLAGKRLWRRLSWGLAFAATVAATWIVILQAPHLHRGSSVPPPQVVSNPLMAPSEPSGTQAASQGRAKGVALDESASEVTTDFIPLGACEDSECMEEAMLVRVSLPAEALLAFGFPMDNDYAPEEPVQADVAMGSDGVPLAIRFVN